MLFSLGKPGYKRKSIRKRAKCPVELTAISVQRGSTRNPSTYGQSLCKDISVTGMRVLTLAPLEVGDVLQISFSLGEHTRKLSLRAEVKNITKENRNGMTSFAVGFEFVSIPDREKKYLLAIIDLYP